MVVIVVVGKAGRVMVVAEKKEDVGTGLLEDVEKEGVKREEIMAGELRVDCNVKGMPLER